MSERKPFLLRLDPATISALKVWASDDLRSLNGQIEFLLRRALREAGRLTTVARANAPSADEEREQPGSTAASPVPELPRRTRVPSTDAEALKVE